MEAMPLIQKLLQPSTPLPRTEVHSATNDPAMSSASSFPESAFLETLTAFKSLPDFKQHLSTVNGHGQSLLHLAVHLRYRELVQRLVDWGIELNTNDVNRFTALDAAYLCNDSSIVHILENRGAIALILDELGQPLTEPADMMTKATVGASQEINQTKLERADLTQDKLLSVEPIVDPGGVASGHCFVVSLPLRPLTSTYRISTNLRPEGSRGTIGDVEVHDARGSDVREHTDSTRSPELYSSDNTYQLDEPTGIHGLLASITLGSNLSVASKASG